MRRITNSCCIIGTAVAATAWGQLSPVSAYRSVHSYYRDWLGDDYSFNPETTEFGWWSRQYDMAGQDSDLSPDLIEADLWASLRMRDEPGGAQGEGSTSLSHEFSVATPTLVAWSYNMDTYAGCSGYYDLEPGDLIATASFSLSGAFYSFVWNDSINTAYRADAASGFSMLDTGMHTVEVCAEPVMYTAPMGSRADATAEGFILPVYGGTPSPRQLEVLVEPGAVEIDTFGSDFDTILAVYDVAGALLAMNDDDGGPQSRVVELFDEGPHVAVVGGAGASFENDGFSFSPGHDSGEIRFSINGEAVDPAAILAGELQLYTFFVSAAEPPEAVDLGVITPDGPTRIEITEAYSYFSGGAVALYDAAGRMLADQQFTDSVDLAIELPDGEYYLGVAVDPLDFHAGFRLTQGSCIYDCCQNCLEFWGAIAGVPFSGQSWSEHGCPTGFTLMDPAFFSFQISLACNPADLAEPWGLLDLADVTAFASAFVAGDLSMDLDGSGVLDLADVVAFVEAFVAGCD